MAFWVLFQRVWGIIVYTLGVQVLMVSPRSLRPGLHQEDPHPRPTQMDSEALLKHSLLLLMIRIPHDLILKLYKNSSSKYIWGDAMHIYMHRHMLYYICVYMYVYIYIDIIIINNNGGCTTMWYLLAKPLPQLRQDLNPALPRSIARGPKDHINMRILIWCVDT